MSHDGSWRAACRIRISKLSFRFGHHEKARGVTDPGVGSGALLALFVSRPNDGAPNRAALRVLLTNILSGSGLKIVSLRKRRSFSTTFRDLNADRRDDRFAGTCIDDEHLRAGDRALMATDHEFDEGLWLRVAGKEHAGN